MRASLPGSSSSIVSLREHAERKAGAPRTDLAAVRRAQRYIDAAATPAVRTEVAKQPGVVVDMTVWCASNAGRDAAFRALFAAVEATTLPPTTPLIEPSHVWQMPSETPRR